MEASDVVPLRRDLVTVGASAGGVEPLKTLVSHLPADLPAAVLVALHLPASARSHLAEILSRSCALPVRQARPGLRLSPGEVVVAHPDAHLLVVDDHVVLGTGPRENGSRPSHDAMLRSAALARRSRVVGIVLTGLLDDGAAGLRVVERDGGHCLVQDPAEADFPSMWTAALRAVPTARTLPSRARRGGRPSRERGPARRAGGPRGAVAARPRRARQRPRRRPRPAHGSPTGEPSPYACPDCHGVLDTAPDPGVLRFRDRAGHAWSAESLVAQQDTDVEEALWTALRVLEERAEMSRRLADLATTNGRGWSQDHFLSRAEEADRSAEPLRAVLRREAQQPAVPSTASGTAPASWARDPSGPPEDLPLPRPAPTVGVATYGEDVDLLQVEPSELEALLDVLLIDGTAVFRDPGAWEELADPLLPEVLWALDPDEPVRVWSLAMLLHTLLGDEQDRRRVKVYATDIDEHALGVARQGRYRPDDLAGLTAQQRETCFEPDGALLRFRSDLRPSPIFGRHDLLQDAPISRVVLLSCRNVLMHFTAETQSRVLERFTSALHGHGLLRSAGPRCCSPTRSCARR